MAPRVTPDCDEIAILVASQRVCASGLATLRQIFATLSQARQELQIDIRNPYAPISGFQITH